MKKITFIFTILLLVAALLCGCGANETPDTTEKKTENIMQKADPSEDDTLNILMIGNSFSSYFTDELYAIGKAAGVKMRVCNVYYSGCTLAQHATWLKEGKSEYQFRMLDDTGRQEIEGCDLVYCLEQQNWDVISIQESSSGVRTKSGAEAFAVNETHISELLAYIRKQFPLSTCCWQQTWAYQVGYDHTDSNGYKVDSLDEQKAYAQRQYDFAVAVCEKFDLSRINTGEAWQIVREKYGYDNLCARMDANGGMGDYYHDGDYGGGQYLNACVWFEILTGKSCIGNTFRPNYGLKEDMVLMLQQAAHEAVENLNITAN